MWAGRIKLSDHDASLVGGEKFWLAREKLAPLVGNWDLDYLATLLQHLTNQSKVRIQGNRPMRRLEIWNQYYRKALKITLQVATHIQAIEIHPGLKAIHQWKGSNMTNWSCFHKLGSMRPSAAGRCWRWLRPSSPSGAQAARSMMYDEGLKGFAETFVIHSLGITVSSTL